MPDPSGDGDEGVDSPPSDDEDVESDSGEDVAPFSAVSGVDESDIESEVANGLPFTVMSEENDSGEEVYAS